MSVRTDLEVMRHSLDEIDEALGRMLGECQGMIETLAYIEKTHPPKPDTVGRFLLDALQDRAIGMVVRLQDVLKFSEGLNLSQVSTSSPGIENTDEPA